MINNVTIAGRLTRDVELRYTGSGTPVGNFTLAVDRPFKNAQGEKEVDFINCVIWRKSAEALANYTKKGSAIAVVGRIQVRNYENKEGAKVYITEVVCEMFSMLESKAVTESRINNDHSNYGNSGTHKNNNDPYGNTGEPIDISDDDLPF